MNSSREMSDDDVKQLLVAAVDGNADAIAAIRTDNNLCETDAEISAMAGRDLQDYFGLVLTSSITAGHEFCPAGSAKSEKETR